MIVSREDFADAVVELRESFHLGLDTESTGLRMYHGAEACSIIIANDKESYYFNFFDKPAHDGSVAPPEFVLDKTHLKILDEELFRDEKKTWYIQRAANFDLPILARWGVYLRGTVHCTLTMGRVVYNERMGYSLEQQLPEIGLQKDQSVEDYVAANHLFELIKIPGKQARDKDKFYWKVPFNILAPYGENDGSSVLALGTYQNRKIKEADDQYPELVESGRSLKQVADNERRLVKTIFRMKDYGCQIDKGYCEKAIRYENDRHEKAAAQFRLETGHEFKSSPKLFAQVFEDQKEKWKYTPKGNPSFDAEVLSTFQGPAATAILDMRDAKSKSDFYQGFLYHADERGIVHPNFNAEGAAHGRFSSSEPNFQNLTSEDDEESLQKEFVVRRAVIPRPGFVLLMPDYSQMEYKFALEMALRIRGEITDLGKRILGGADFHEATGELAKEITGVSYPRKVIKTANFLTLYGGGVGKLAQSLGIPMREARIIRSAIMQAAPEITGDGGYIRTIMQIAEERGFIVNWFGRRSHFPVKHFCYKAPNYHVSGGCADVVKLAMNRIDEYLLTKKSRMTMTIHDELVIECHESELKEVPGVIAEIMATAFPAKYIPLNVDMEYSRTSLADKTKGFP